MATLILAILSLVALSEGLGLDWPEHGGTLDRIGAGGACHIIAKFKSVVLGGFHAGGDTKDDYVILDGEKSVGRIYKEHGERRFWSVNTSPYPAPPPNNGLAKSLEEAKRQFKERYEEMKAAGAKPFA